VRSLVLAFATSVPDFGATLEWVQLKVRKSRANGKSEKNQRAGGNSRKFLLYLQPIFPRLGECRHLLAATAFGFLPDDLGCTVAAVGVLKSRGEVVVRPPHDGSGSARLAIGRLVTFARQARDWLFVSREFRARSN